MKYIIDNSALINIVLREYFLDLIFYEIESYLRKYKEINKDSNNKIKEMTELFNYIIWKANIKEVWLNYEILDLSIKEKLSYYDAVYLYLARKYNLILISDDMDLIEKVTMISNDLLRNLKILFI